MHSNRLANETSPYLLQHAHNPVDWYAWGPDAFERSRTEDKPIFLSIGYSACHWCHVMERESFEDHDTAAVLNREFVSIKVDREERPDVDSIYMQAVQMMTGHGGWPMSMFLTPEGVPFYAGTYFPPHEGRGMPSFRRVLAHVADAYRNKRDDVLKASEEIRTAIQSSVQMATVPSVISRESLHNVAARIAANHDPVNGGFGGAPKFPPSMTLEVLLQLTRSGQRPDLMEIVNKTLRKMAYGGIYDQVGGGFHRYSVDAHWLAPHFEKMLYDNALLTRVYLHAWQSTQDPLYARIVHEVIGFLLREMTSPDGGFYSTLDADSEGEEGKFYVWQRAEIMNILGPEEGRIFCALYDVTERGNWEGKNILNLGRDPEEVAADVGVTPERLSEIAAKGKCKLYGEREKRVRPGRDEKILAGWNGWMLGALSEASLAFGRAEVDQAVRANADFLIDRMMDGSRLWRSYKDGRARIPGLLEDYSGVAWGLIHAFQATGERRYLDAAQRLAGQITERFRDESSGGFFDTPDDHEKLITRPRDIFDNATPSGNAVAIDVLFRLSHLLGRPELDDAARRALSSLWAMAEKYPSGFGFALCQGGWVFGSPKEVVLTGVAGESVRESLRTRIGQTYLPHHVFVPGTPGLPVMEGRDPARPLVYVCENFACAEPTADPDKLAALLGE